MKFFQWLLANKDALLAIIGQLEKIFGGGVPSLARVGASRPTSKEQCLAESFGTPRLPSDAKSFAELITA